MTPPDDAKRNRDFNTTKMLLWIVAAGSVAIVASIVIGTVIITHEIKTSVTRTADKVGQAADAFGKVFLPTVNRKEALNGAVTALTKQAKLVITEANIVADVNKSESYSWWGVYFGTTVAHVRAKCKVQYFVPLDGFSQSQIEAVETSTGQKLLRVWLLQPAVDEGFVDIDQSTIEIESSSGWARFNKNEVAAQARNLLRSDCVRAANDGAHIRAAEVSADAVARKLLEPLVNKLQQGVNLEVGFRRPPG
jgi:hypothetical protein